MSRLVPLAQLYEIPAAERSRLRAALRPVPKSACIRGVFAWPLRSIVVARGEHFVSRYVELERRLALIRSPFAWVPLTDFVLRWTFAGHLAYPELELAEATAAIVEENVAILSKVQTVQTLLRAADDDLRTYLVQGVQSANLFQNFGVHTVIGSGPNWVETYTTETWWPAARYIQLAYNAGVYRLFEVDGETEISDETETSFTMRLTWTP